MVNAGHKLHELDYDEVAKGSGATASKGEINKELKSMITNEIRTPVKKSREQKSAKIFS